MTLIKVKSRGTDNVSGRRNLAINGAMQSISKRNNNWWYMHSEGYKLRDRWNIYILVLQHGNIKEDVP